MCYCWCSCFVWLVWGGQVSGGSKRAVEAEVPCSDTPPSLTGPDKVQRSKRAAAAAGLLSAALFLVRVAAGLGLVAASPGGPARAEGGAGAGDRPGGVLAGQAFEAGGLGDGEPDRGDAGRAGLPAAGGDGRVAERDAQVGAADVVLAVAAAVVVANAGGGAWEGDVGAQVVADGGVAGLGEGGQGGVTADRVPGAGLALVPARQVLSRFERFLGRPPAACDGDEERHGRRGALPRPGH